MIKEIVSPENVKEYGELKSEENFEFRTFLKCHVDEDKLDKQFLILHDKFFKNYDCTKCRNCCEILNPIINEYEIEDISKHLNITKEEFIKVYLESENGKYAMKNKPCDFLEIEGCQIYEIRPNVCKKYPHTNEKNRLSSIWSIIDNTKICPVVYEIVEKLKDLYNFKRYK